MRALPGATGREDTIHAPGVARVAGVSPLSRLPEHLVEMLGLPPVCAAIARFLGVGLLGLAVDSGLFAWLFSQGASAASARAVSLFAATVVTWIANRHVTFERSDRAPAREFAVYAGVALAVQGFNYVLFLALVSLATDTNPLACLVASAIVTAALSFTGHSFFTFARRGERRGAGVSR